MKVSDKFAGVMRAPAQWLLPMKNTLGESRGVQILSGVLALQLVLAGGLLWQSGSQDSVVPAERLVSIDPSSVTEILIDDGENSVSLTRDDAQWRLNDEHATLASTEKVDELLSSVSDLKPGLPVASTVGSHKQLEVAEDTFQRRMTLKAGEEVLADLYMGTSPGFRKAHLRQAGENQVYAARLNTFDVPAEQGDWLEPNLLAFTSVDAIKFDDVELALSNGQWSIVLPQDKLTTHEVDQTAMESLVAELGTLRVNGFAEPLVADEPTDTPADDDTAQPEPLLTHTLAVISGDNTATLTLNRKGTDATVEHSDIKGLFALPLAAYNRLNEDALTSLIIEKSADGSEGSDEASQPQG